MIRNLVLSVVLAVLSVVLALALFGTIVTASAQNYVPPATINNCTTYGVGDTAYTTCRALALFGSIYTARRI